MKSGIYQIRNIINDKRYIGSAVNIIKRFREHRHALKNDKHYSHYLQRAWNKHGKDYFKFEIILYCSKENILFYEQQAIDVYGSSNGGGYNLRVIAISNLGTKWSEESRRRISEARKGQPSNKKGIPLSEETKRRISIKLMGRKLPPEQVKKMSEDRKGKPITEEQKLKISAALKGRKRTLPVWNVGLKTGPRSMDVRRRISETLAGKPKPYLRGKPTWNKGKALGPHTEDTKRKMSETHKKRWKLLKTANPWSAIEAFPKVKLSEVMEGRI